MKHPYQHQATCPKCGVLHTVNTKRNKVMCPTCAEDADRKRNLLYCREYRRRLANGDGAVPPEIRRYARAGSANCYRVVSSPCEEFMRDFEHAAFPAAEVTCMLTMGIIPQFTRLENSGIVYEVHWKAKVRI